ncbi:hypothetical protein [Devosia chinhatensis]|uniref:Uncharacterized protein n=1 Tax=Devosia chinhatensis TaxID=429727 RepID=A0A0F5FLW8_9HYPH|nr:hypothetical protein [Devosia chinhatensis]KKB09808.1 hypothetical protein VE26_08135 [Devosia chinhatensis]
MWAAAQEAEAFLVSGTTPVDRVAALTPNPTTPGLAVGTRELALRDCATVVNRLGSLEMLYRPEAERQAMAEACLEMASSITAEMPNYSYGWYVGAAAAAALKDWTEMNDRLWRSQVSGPTEQWIAMERVALSERYVDKLDARALAAEDADLRMIVVSSRGIRALARSYVSRPQFRERVTGIVESMPSRDQRRFLFVLNEHLAATR